MAYKVGDDLASIATAARRFLQPDADSMRATIHELFAGHLRAIVGGMSVEDMLHNREELTANIRSSLADDRSKSGLVVDSLQIQEIDDDSGYIENLGKPQAAEIAAAARIAAAERDKEATAREQAANAEKAAAVRESSIKQVGYQPRSTKPRAGRCSPARWPRRWPDRKSYVPRPRRPNSTPLAGRRSSSPRCASPLTRRPTAR
ncbi:MAG: flotillin family protein [Geodermatophilaceae bacterium]